MPPLLGNPNGDLAICIVTILRCDGGFIEDIFRDTAVVTADGLSEC